MRSEYTANEELSFEGDTLAERIRDQQASWANPVHTRQSRSPRHTASSVCWWIGTIIAIAIILMGAGPGGFQLIGLTSLPFWTLSLILGGRFFLPPKK